MHLVQPWTIPIACHVREMELSVRMDVPQGVYLTGGIAQDRKIRMERRVAAMAGGVSNRIFLASAENDANVDFCS